MLSGTHRHNLSVSIHRATKKVLNLVAFFIILAPSLTGINPVQAKKIEGDKAPLYSDFSPQQQTPACSEGGELVVADGEECSLSPGIHTYTSVTVQSGGKIILESDINTNTGVTLQVNTLTVEEGGLIDADGQGYQASTGDGRGVDNNQAGGAGHGGIGGNSANGTLGGNTYGSLYEPITLGSGGGSAGSYLGGNGGGAIKIVVTGDMVLNGMISSNGLNGNSRNDLRAGGGAGGSIWINANTLTGSGEIQANGGRGSEWYGRESGGGAGGRIAIDISRTFAYGQNQVI